MDVDFSLVGDEIEITDEYISLILDGTFHAASTEGQMSYDDQEGPRPELPTYRNDREPSQLIISDYAMNSLMQATMDLGWWDITKPTRSQDIESYLKGFETAFGIEEKVNVTCTPVAGKQVL